MNEERCGATTDDSRPWKCSRGKDHVSFHHDTVLDQVWPASPPQSEDGPDCVIPNAVRARVELHRAQTAYDLTVLRAKLDTITVNTAESRRLRGRREQLTAELDAWAYLAKIARSPR